MLLKAVAADPRDRFGDVLELAFELENGAACTRPTALRKKALYDRNPLVFWKGVSLCLLILLIISLAQL